MTISIIKSNDTFSAKFSYVPATKAANVTFSCRRDEKSDRYALTSVIDFSGCSQAEIIELATRTVVIDLQRQWRVLAASNLANATRANPFSKVNVKAAIVDATRKTATPIAKAKSAASKLTDAEKRAMIAELEASLKPAVPAKVAASKAQGQTKRS